MTRYRAMIVATTIVIAGCGRGPVAGPAPAPATPPDEMPLFADVAAASGIDFRHGSGAEGAFLLPEIMGGGGGFLDVDGDGRLDVYLVQSRGTDDTGNRLYRNLGEGRFEDVTELAEVGDTGYGMGCAAGDYDNDGDVDLYVTNLGANVLYRNDGDGTFTDVTDHAGPRGPGWSTSAAFVDVDADGDLDLFVTDYVAWRDAAGFVDRDCYADSGARDYCSPRAYDAPTPDALYRNDGDGTFTNISAESGIASRSGTGLGVVCTDLDGDADVDIYVANDQMASFAWINDGTGRFAERAVPMGIAVDASGQPQAGMGVDAADLEDDGDFDLWKVHLHRETHVLYVNHGHYFDDATIRWGLAAPTRRSTGFGTALFDVDLDGHLDAFVANGRVQMVDDPEDASDPYAEPNLLLRQREAGRFEIWNAGPDVRRAETSRAAAFGDYDNDGDVDVLVVNRDGPARLLRNDAPRAGRALTLRVRDEAGRDALGATVVVHVGERRRTFEVRAAASYCATNDPRVHVGLGEADGVDRVDVTWPDGTTGSFGPFEAGAFEAISKPAS